MLVPKGLLGLHRTVQLQLLRHYWLGRGGGGEVAPSCPTLCDPMDCDLLGFSVSGILQARILEWIAITFSRGSS